jgi:hypothetical protein
LPELQCESRERIWRKILAMNTGSDGKRHNPTDLELGNGR